MDVIKTAHAQRKRVVLGQIADYAGNPNPKYRDAYRMAREICDQVVFVGEHSHRSKATEEERKNGRFVEVSDVKSAYEHIRSTAVENEVILLKGSQNQHLERVMLAWKYDVKCWVDKCGKLISCQECGLFEHPFDPHGAIWHEGDHDIGANYSFHYKD
jgi:UDP-N-acetylmuramoyl-tripeptide--D-alanyl-D-alanine ligase